MRDPQSVTVVRDAIRGLDGLIDVPTDLTSSLHAATTLITARSDALNLCRKDVGGAYIRVVNAVQSAATTLAEAAIAGTPLPTDDVAEHLTTTHDAAASAERVALALGLALDELYDDNGTDVSPGTVLSRHSDTIHRALHDRLETLMEDVRRDITTLGGRTTLPSAPELVDLTSEQQQAYRRLITQHLELFTQLRGKQESLARLLLNPELLTGAVGGSQHSHTRVAAQVRDIANLWPDCYGGRVRNGITLTAAPPPWPADTNDPWQITPELLIWQAQTGKAWIPTIRERLTADQQARQQVTEQHAAAADDDYPVAAITDRPDPRTPEGWQRDTLALEQERRLRQATSA